MVLNRNRYYKIKGTNNSGGGTTPVGIINITENGAHDVTNYAVAEVNVPIPNGYIMPSGTLEVNENGTHNVKEYESVNVNVPTTGGGTANGLPLEVSELPSSKSAVPNSGTVEKVYFNTSLSREEYLEIVSQLTLQDLSSFGLSDSYISLSNADASKIMVINTGHIWVMNATTMELDTIIYDHNTSDGDFYYFAESEYDFNDSAISSFMGFPVGAENELIKNLFYVSGGSAGVEGAVYKVGSEPTAVPNSGTVENVYLNNNLSTEEVVSLLSQLTYNYGGSNYLVIANDSNNGLTIANEGDLYVIIDFSNQVIYFASSENESLGNDFVGWNPSISNFVYNFNDTAVSTFEEDGETFSVGAENDKLAKLFSTTPNFGSSDYYLCENGSFTKLVKETTE